MSGSLIRLFGAACALVALGPASMTVSDAPGLAYDAASVRTGDMVFRRGRSTASAVVAVLDPTTPFSHVGIVIVRKDGPWVVHAAPPPDQDTAGVRIEPLAAFLRPDLAETAALLRREPLEDEQAERVAEHALRYMGRAFDGLLDSQSAVQLYCTEFVALAFADAGLDLDVTPHTLRTPLGVRTVLRPSDLLASPMLREIPFIHSVPSDHPPR